MAFEYTFQDWENGFPNIGYGITYTSPAPISVYNSSYGGIGISAPSTYETGIKATNYLAFDTVGISAYAVKLYDAFGDMKQSKSFNIPAGTHRIEVAIDTATGIPSYYLDGVLSSQGAALTVAITDMTVKPSAGTGYIDNVVTDSSVPVLVGAIPKNWTVVHDVIAGTNGVYAYALDGTPVSKSSVYMTVDVAGGGTLLILDPSGNTVYSGEPITEGGSGAVQVNLATMLTAAGNAYGAYSACAGSQCDSFWVTGAGASLVFDKVAYTKQDVATLTYVVTDSYWDTSTYRYSIEITNANTGAVMSTQLLSTSSGSVTYTWPSDAENGMYYASLIATKNSDNTRVYMTFTTATLFGYAIFQGYVNDAETGLVIPGANVTVTQDTKASINITGSTGYYVADDSFIVGLPTTFNVTASGYSQYYQTITPIEAKTINLNITLNSTTPAFGGKGVGGVAREGLQSGSTITKGYGRPIQGALVLITNITSGSTYTKTTSMTGWYSCSEAESCILASGRLYNISASKTGYNNSPHYGVLIP